MRYSKRGGTGKKGNFFTHINNAEKEFGTDEMIRHDIRRYMSKIRKSLKNNTKI